MLVLTRKQNQSIIIADNILVKIVEIGDGSVKIGIEAPRNIPIHREEVFEEIQKENRRATEIAADFKLEDLLKKGT